LLSTSVLQYIQINNIRPSETEMPGLVTYDNNLGYLKHLYIKQQTVKAITSDPKVQNGASK